MTSDPPMADAGDHPDEPTPHWHAHHVPKPGGAVVAGLCCYEVAATTINRALDDDLLPTVTGFVARFGWGRVFHRVFLLGAMGAMWGGLLTGAAGFTLLARRVVRRAVPGPTDPSG